MEEVARAVDDRPLVRTPEEIDLSGQHLTSHVARAAENARRYVDGSVELRTYLAQRRGLILQLGSEHRAVVRERRLDDEGFGHHPPDLGDVRAVVVARG